MSVAESAVEADRRAPTDGMPPVRARRRGRAPISAGRRWPTGRAPWRPGAVAARLVLGAQACLPFAYLSFTCGLPVAWWMSVLLAGGYDTRFIGLGSDEFTGFCERRST